MKRDTLNTALRLSLGTIALLGIALGIISRTEAESFYFFAAAVALGGLVMDVLRARREAQAARVEIKG